MRPKGIADLAAFSAREVKRAAAAEERERDEYSFLCRRTVRVNVGGKAIPASFLKIEGRGTLIGAEDRREREGRIEELVDGQNPGPEAPLSSKSKRSKEDVRRGAMEKGGCVRVIEGEEVREDEPAKYFLPMGVGSTS